MNDESTIVSAYLDAIATSPDATNAKLRDLLVTTGYDHALVSQAIQFVPVAFGRVLLSNLGIQFSPNYILLSGEGWLVERGLLESLEVYRTAQAMTSSRADAMRAVALRSAEVTAINSALNAGSNPADLAAVPVVAFTESATQQGVARAQELLQSLLEDARLEAGSQAEQPRTGKPWWKLW
jgi:hypothetical protein